MYKMKTDTSKKGYVFFNTSDKIVRWSVARGVINSTLSLNLTGVASNAISFFTKQRITSQKQIFSNNISMWQLEKDLEDIRSCNFLTTCVSRLYGLYFFEKEDAENAKIMNYPIHFQDALLSEVNMDPSETYSKHDMNWITFYNNFYKNYPKDWMERYWAGEICSYKDDNFPTIYETLTNSSMCICKKELRENCFNMLADEYPNSMGTLKMSIIAAKQGSSLGSIYYEIENDGFQTFLSPKIKYSESELTNFISNMKLSQEELFLLLSEKDYILTHLEIPSFINEKIPVLFK